MKNKNTETIDQTIKQDLSQNFKVGDKVRILKRHEDSWKTFSFGVIMKMGDKFAYVLDHVKTDSNLALMESCEYFPFESKMLKIIKD